VNDIDLRGRRAVITGGAEGFGRAIAERFLRSGASVSLWDINRDLTAQTARELSTSGPVQTAIADISDREQVDAAVASTLREWPGIDILIANAGLTGPNAPTWEYPPDEWRRVVDVNLVGTFYCCRAVAPIMLTQNYGRIVMISSVAGKDGNPNASAYSAAKAGVIALTKSLGKELASANIAVNCVTPAAARTRIFEQMADTHIKYMLSKIPRGRFLDIQELASLVAWLASEENSFSTGAVWDLSGGRSTY
jgi:NAD(P)-dependent dehydrogenase (short-subunit alcohol dehydrogenase family)